MYAVLTSPPVGEILLSDDIDRQKSKYLYGRSTPKNHVNHITIWTTANHKAVGPNSIYYKELGGIIRDDRRVLLTFRKKISYLWRFKLHQSPGRDMLNSAPPNTLRSIFKVPK